MVLLGQICKTRRAVCYQNCQCHSFQPSVQNQISLQTLDYCLWSRSKRCHFKKIYLSFILIIKNLIPTGLSSSELCHFYSRSSSAKMKDHRKCLAVSPIAAKYCTRRQFWLIYFFLEIPIYLVWQTLAANVRVISQ